MAGNGTIGYSGDGGPATAAELHFPAAPMLFPQQSATGNLYFCDVQNNAIRVLMPDGTIGTVAGNGTAGFSGDGGLAASAELNGPRMVSSSPNGNLYVADFANNRTRLLTRVLPPPAISAGGVVSASSFGEFSSAAPGSWIEIYGTNLAVDSRQWAGSAFTGVNAPTIGGVNASVAYAGLAPNYVGLYQFNVVVPPVPPGNAVPVTSTLGGVAGSQTLYTAVQ